MESSSKIRRHRLCWTSHYSIHCVKADRSHCMVLVVGSVTIMD